MSIADKITSITGHLEDDYTALETLGVSVEDRNIENIKDMANQIYAKFPKTSYAEGSNITLSNTLKGKLDFEDGIVGYGDTKQEGTPTPDNPQEIEVVRGKNRFDIGTSLDDYFQTSTNGTKIGNTSVNVATATISNNKLTIDSYNSSGYNWISKWLNLEKNTNYVISGTNDSAIKIVGFSSNELQTTGTEIIAKNTSDVSKTFNSGDYKYYCLSFYPSTTGKYFENIQIEKGSQATSYLPYNTLEVVERGKNYAKLDQSINNRNADITYTENVANSIVGSKTSNNGQFLATFVAQVVSGQSYIISGTATNCNLYAYKETLGGEPFANISLSTLPQSFTSDYTGTIVLVMYFPSAITGTASIKNFQLEEGSTATTYEPYQTPTTQQLSLGEYEFAKGNDNADEIIYDIENDKVYKNEKMNKKVLNGTEEWFDNTNWDNQYSEILHCYTVVNDWLIGQTQYFCDKFICTTDANRDFTKEMMTCHRTSNVPYIFVFISRLNGVTINSTVEEKINALKAWLSENKPEVWYQLNTPVLKEITTTLKDQIKALYNSHSFTGTTIIEIDGQLPLIIKVRALKGE